jgi:hypothetical protein
MASRSLFVGLGCAVAAFLALVGIGGGAAAYLYWSSPKYSLEQVKTAAEQGDLASFEKYVDIRGICDTGVDRFLEQAAAGGDEDDKVGRAVGVGFLRLLKPAMVDGLQREIKKGVTERKAANEPNRPHIRIQDVATSGDTAHVLLVMPGPAFDPPREKDGRIRIRMRDMGHYWQAYEVVSLEGFEGVGGKRR